MQPEEMNAVREQRALISSPVSPAHPGRGSLGQSLDPTFPICKNKGVVVDQHLPILLIIRISLLDISSGFSEPVGLGQGQKSTFLRNSPGGNKDWHLAVTALTGVLGFSRVKLCP